MVPFFSSPFLLIKLNVSRHTITVRQVPCLGFLLPLSVTGPAGSDNDDDWFVPSLEIYFMSRGTLRSKRERIIINAQGLNLNGTPHPPSSAARPPANSTPAKYSPPSRSASAGPRSPANSTARNAPPHPTPPRTPRNPPRSSNHRTSNLCPGDRRAARHGGPGNVSGFHRQA